MYSAAFIFQPGTYGAEFHRLDGLIDEVARSLDGFLGSETWVSLDGKTKNATYYWSDLESLKVFSQHPDHLEAKRNYAKWYDGYHVIISKVERVYGDGNLQHPTTGFSRPEEVGPATQG
jgi:heme-degrading monooxygenase HmoA